MALGGGIFVSQNKKLPGAYINFVSAARASATLSDRGIVALPIEMDWGEEGKVIELTSDQFLYNSEKLLGYDYGADWCNGLRDVFLNATKVYLYKLNTGVKAANKFCTARFGGKRGNDLKTVIVANVDEPSKFDVKTILGTKIVDIQTGVSGTTSELADNDYVVWLDSVAIEETASTPLTGGSNGEVNTASWQAAFSALESYSFNTLGVVSETEEVKKLAATWTKRMRDEIGVKFQTVVSNYAADDKGVINVVTGTEAKADCPALVFWVTGAQAGCAVNASCTNKVYDGEFAPDVSRTQAQLVECIDKGEFVLHRVGDEIRVLTDINSKVSVSVEENEDFKSNQVIRVLDQIANDIAVLFATKYLGVIPNDEAGRISLWNDIVKHHQELQQLRAIEGFTSENVVVTKGDTKKSVVVSDMVTPVNAMEQLYMTVTVS